MAYIIGSYNKWDQWDREHAKYTFEINGNWYAVKEVEMDLGVPKLPLRIDIEDNPEVYYVYDTKEDAMQFVRMMKKLN